MNENYLDELNPVQRGAVTTTEGPVLIVAGPGSGKTRVLTYRIAHLLETKAKPYEILALTFTNKSAKEMKERIAKVVGDSGRQVWAGTFHSLFGRILRIEASKIGYPSDFTIYDSDDSKSVVASIISEQNLDSKVYDANSIRSRISSAKSNLISPEEYLADKDLQLEDQQSKRPFIGKIYQMYQKRCERAGAMDFDDLLYLFFFLLKRNPDVLEKYQKRFKYVMVDEFQDTNCLQYAIVRLLVIYPNSPQNICVVGDDAQSIYAFRGATIQNILDFKNDFPKGNMYKLEQNYRSTKAIVEAANKVISNNGKQIKKTIWTDKEDGETIKIIKAITDGEEGKRVADMIMEQKNRYHVRNSEIAILYRTNAQSRGFEEALRRSNVAYRVYGGQSFYQRKEIKDVLSYLRLLVNPNDEEALRRIINYPTRKIGKTTVDKLSAIADAEQKSMGQIIGNQGLMSGLGAAAITVKGFGLMMDSFRKRVSQDSAYDLATLVVKQSGIITDLKRDQTPDGVSRLENVNALLDGIQDFVENDEAYFNELDDAESPTINDRSLAAYLQSIALITDADKDNGEVERVTLMSVHSAKGLEFKSVFVVGLEENLFPSHMAAQSPDGMDEERRLFYVAITRAELFLTLTFAASRYRFGQMRMDEPSRFLKEMGLSPTGRLVTTQEEQRATVSGLRRPNAQVAAPSPAVIANFKASPPAAIKTGARVVHQRFGEGEVKDVDGSGDSLIATIAFVATSDEKRIVLKFAKLMVIG